MTKNHVTRPSQSELNRDAITFLLNPEGKQQHTRANRVGASGAGWRGEGAEHAAASQTVNETSHTPPSNDDPTHINSLQSLGEEATMINQNFSQQVLDKKVRHALLPF